MSQPQSNPPPRPAAAHHLPQVGPSAATDQLERLLESLGIKLTNVAVIRARPKTARKTKAWERKRKVRKHARR